ncbi:MAG: hypothetical protein ACYC7J_16955 [Syntrophales bacterium]
MGRSMYNSAKRGKEKARQQKQMEKSEKRRIAKQQKVNLQAGAPNAESDIAKPEPVTIGNSTAQEFGGVRS